MEAGVQQLGTGVQQLVSSRSAIPFSEGLSRSLLPLQDC